MAETEALATVQEITGSDTNRARNLLDSCNGDVEQAIALHFASCDFDAHGAPPNDTDSVQAPVAMQHALWNGSSMPADIAEPPTRSVPSEGGAVSSANATAPEVQPHTPSWSIFGSLKRAFSVVSQTVAGIASEDFEEWFLTNYGTPHPQFSSENYSETMFRAQRENKLAILWFHKGAAGTPDNDACCRCFQHEAVLNAVSDNFLLYACDASRFDAAQIAARLNVGSFPCLVVVKPVRSAFDDPFVLEWPSGVFCKPVGRVTSANFDPDVVMLFLLRLVEEAHAHEHIHEMATNARLRQNEEIRRIREIQDREYEDGLLRDQLRQIEHAESSSVSAPSEVPPTPMPSGSTHSGMGPSPGLSTPLSPLTPTPPMSPKDVVPEWKQTRRALAEKILAIKPVEVGRTTKISLRFPSGYRCDKVLTPTTEATTLYMWAESIEEQMIISQEVHERGPRDIPRKISIWTSYPPKEIPNSSESLESLGLCPATALNVRFHKDS